MPQTDIPRFVTPPSASVAAKKNGPQRLRLWRDYAACKVGSGNSWIHNPYLTSQHGMALCRTEAPSRDGSAATTSKQQQEEFDDQCKDFLFFDQSQMPVDHNTNTTSVASRNYNLDFSSWSISHVSQMPKALMNMDYDEIRQNVQQQWSSIAMPDYEDVAYYNHGECQYHAGHCVASLHHAMVRFKSSIALCVLSDEALCLSAPLNLCEYVLVDIGFGIKIGQVCEIRDEKCCEFTRNVTLSQPTIHGLAILLRRASYPELKFHRYLEEKESECLKNVTSYCSQMHLPVDIVQCEIHIDLESVELWYMNRNYNSGCTQRRSLRMGISSADVAPLAKTLQHVLGCSVIMHCAGRDNIHLNPGGDDIPQSIEGRHVQQRMSKFGGLAVESRSCVNNSRHNHRNRNHHHQSARHNIFSSRLNQQQRQHPPVS